MRGLLFHNGSFKEHKYGNDIYIYIYTTPK